MATNWRALKRRILTPSFSETKLDTRGFHVKDAPSRDFLETVGETFLTGYGYAVESRTPDEAAERLDAFSVEFRGFAYEGAAMGFVISDVLPFGPRNRFARFLAGPGESHIYMSYVGLGWALARLPRFLWPKNAAPDPLLRWLVHDGYGFHQAYFHTDRYVHGHFQDSRFDGDGPYAARAIDQGIGRALWFVGGTDPDVTATLIDGFPEHRRADLFAGAGLAATYAGAAGKDELLTLRSRAGAHWRDVAQGSAFAAEARMRAGLVVPHTETATRVFCGMGPDEAARATREVRPEPLDHGDTPAYEVWRQQIADRIVSLGGVRK